MNISTKRGYEGGEGERESTQEEEGYINLIYDRGGKGRDKKDLLQKVCINKDTTCSAAQGRTSYHK
jgi:hypothetical protein